MIVSWVKALHIAALVIWCAGLIALPLLLARHHVAEEQADYARLRRLTHYGYVRVVTPAAVIAIAAGTILVFVQAAFIPWMFAKLVAVGFLVALHALVGHTVVIMSERRGEYQPPAAWPLVSAMLTVMTLVLVIVLAKPLTRDLTPDWLERPLDRQLPVEETPI